MDNKRHSVGGTFNTFFFGVLVGICLTLLFTTKKGRKLLKVITDEGVERIGRWEELMEKVESGVSDDFDDLPDDGDYVDEKTVPKAETQTVQEAEQDVKEVHHKKGEHHTKEKTEESARKSELKDDEVKKVETKEEEPATKSTNRRFFRGIRKK